jgi:hypothetical protein
MKSSDIYPTKIQLCDHNLKLASEHQKNNSKSVTIIFKIFFRKRTLSFFCFHYMEIKEIKKLKKNLPRFFCELCDFKCYMKCDWDRHILRPKHLNNVEVNNWKQKT